ncbi:MAG TPA: hypothetical protein VF469_16160 [Kofleriaceae bacterium]
MQRLLLVWSFVVWACSGNTPASTPDAAEPPPGTFGARCGMASDTAPDCDSHVCTSTIDSAGHNVCSLQCTTDAMCPVGSLGMKCNMKGFCKP